MFLHDYLLQKIRAQNPQKVFLKDVTLGRTETFGHFVDSVVRVASGLTKVATCLLYNGFASFNYFESPLAYRVN